MIDDKTLENDSTKKDHEERVKAFEKVDPEFAKLLKKYQNTHKVEDADEETTKED